MRTSVGSVAACPSCGSACTNSAAGSAARHTSSSSAPSSAIGARVCAAVTTRRPSGDWKTIGGSASATAADVSDRQKKNPSQRPGPGPKGDVDRGVLNLQDIGRGATLPRSKREHQEYVDDASLLGTLRLMVEADVTRFAVKPT